MMDRFEQLNDMILPASDTAMTQVMHELTGKFASLKVESDHRMVYLFRVAGNGPGYIIGTFKDNLELWGWIKRNCPDNPQNNTEPYTSVEYMAWSWSKADRAMTIINGEKE